MRGPLEALASAALSAHATAAWPTSYDEQFPKFTGTGRFNAANKPTDVSFGVDLEILLNEF